MSSYSMDIESFINEVKKFPELWNNNSEDSRSPVRRHQAWTEVARVLIEDFDDLGEIERSDVYKRLQGKWRNIRDSFVRNKRRNVSTKKGYIYAKQLAFLEDAYNSYNKTSQSGSDVEVTQNDPDDSWPSEYEAKLKKLFESGFDSKDEPLIVWPNEESREKRRKKRSLQGTQIDFVESNYSEPGSSYSNEDEDRAFFISLLPSVRDFDTDKKLEFRADLIKLIKLYRKKGSFREESD